MVDCMQAHVMRLSGGPHLRLVANAWGVLTLDHPQSFSMGGRRHRRVSREDTRLLTAARPLHLDLGLTGPALNWLGRRMQGLAPEAGGFRALHHQAGKKSQASTGEEAMPPEGLQESLWQGFFSDPTQWRDNRRSKPTPRHPDFRHKFSKLALWLDNPLKPAWVDSQLATWDAGIKTPPESVCTSVQGQGALGRLAAHEGQLEVEMCRKQCVDGRITEAVDALNLMVERGWHVDRYLLYLILKRSIPHKDLLLSRRIHALTIECGYEGDAFLATHLIGLFSSHGRLEEAMQVFAKVATPSSYNWASIIFAYARHGEPAQAIRLYRQLREWTMVEPDNRIYVAVLKACAAVGDLVAGKEVHSHILASPGGKTDRFVQTGLVDMYAKCGSLEDARRVFDKLLLLKTDGLVEDTDIVTWTAMIAGYAQQRMGEEALSLYNRMQQEGLGAQTDAVTYLCLLQACATVAALRVGKQLHAQIEERGLQADPGVGAALVNMYAKCGSMPDSQQVFDSLPQRSMETWGALAGGYTRQGDSEVVFDLLDRMRLEGLEPDGIMFLCVLTVCSHAGIVDKGRKYFEAMSTNYGISPTVEHYICMMDLLGRAGHLEEALRMAKTMPFPPNGTVWRTLLGACRKWNHVEIGKQAFDYAVSVDGKDAAPYVLMSNIYASSQMWEEAMVMEARRVKSEAWKKPGQSWWTDAGGVVHTFVVPRGQEAS